MTTSQEQSCSECGQPANCPHMKKKPVVIMPAESSDYDPLMCKSFDHKHPVIQMQSINYAMMHFFGGMVSSGGPLTGDILNYEWLKDRGEVEPLYNFGDYMMYRRGYKFD